MVKTDFGRCVEVAVFTLAHQLEVEFTTGCNRQNKPEAANAIVGVLSGTYRTP